MDEGQDLGPYLAGWLSSPLLVGGRAREAPGRGLTERDALEMSANGAFREQFWGAQNCRVAVEAVSQTAQDESQSPSLDPEPQHPYSLASHLDSQCHPRQTEVGTALT